MSLQPALFIADDNAAFRAMIVRCATQNGWETGSCADGRELLDALRVWRGPALVLIDMIMPELDGFETIKGLAALDNSVNLRLRFVTGGPDHFAIAARMIASAKQLDVGPTVLKPLRIEALEALLDFEKRLLAAHRGPSQT